MAISPDIRDLATSFSQSIEAEIEAEVLRRVRAAVFGAFDTSLPKMAPAPRKPGAALSPKRRRAQKLQGRYLGALRALGKRDRARVKASAKEKGVAEALRLAAKLRSS